MSKLRFRSTLICAALVLSAPLILLAQEAQKVIATVDGQPIYEQDLMSVAGRSLLDLRNQEYKAESDALNKMIRQKLLEAEAKKKGVSVEELFKQEVDSKISEPSDDEARGYYLAVKNPSTLPFEQIKPQVKQLLKNSEIQHAREKYADSLREKAAVSILLQPPAVHVGYDPARVRGNPGAPVTIVEFADFQCPYCKNVEAALKDLLAKHDGQVKLAFRDFPLRTIHARAEAAAEAGRCAQEQSKFWEYHDALFADQTKLDDAGLTATAEKVGLDGKLFRSCLSSSKYKAQIEEDVQDGTKAGVTGTPSFFINGEFVNGAQPQAEFEKIIERQLAAAGAGSAARASR